MIINTQAFASSLKEDGKSKEAPIIYSKRDEFGSRRPIDVIKANRPRTLHNENAYKSSGGESFHFTADIMMRIITELAWTQKIPQTLLGA